VAGEETDFSDEFCRFLQGLVPAVEAAELLLAIMLEPSRAWSLEEALAALGPGIRLSAADAARYVERMQGRLLASVEGNRIRYQPASEELAAHARTLERMYRERPVTLIRLIYALRDDRIRSFADAFKLRRR
jgi:hypothetical protein